jgi:hypothetical protein
MNDTPDRPDSLERLHASGFDLSMFNAEQLALLGSLDEDELTVLLEIRERIGDVRAEVEAHDQMDQMETSLVLGGLLF